MRVKASVLITLFLSACASVPSELPDNMELEAGAYNASYIKHIYFDYPTQMPLSLEKAQQCVALHVDNKPQIIKDSANSWVGPFTGNYYRDGSAQVVGGGQTVNSVSKELSSIVAAGNTKYSNGFGSDIVQFKMLVSLKDSSFRISFVGIERAQSDTGILENSGFEAVGVWSGSRYMQVYSELERLAGEIALCNR